MGMVLRGTVLRRGARACVLSWQRRGGVNERFAISRGHEAVWSYANRMRYGMGYCHAAGGRPLHSEKLLACALRRGNVPWLHTGMRTSRVRSNGVIKAEDFSPGRAQRLRRAFQRDLLGVGRAKRPHFGDIL